MPPTREMLLKTIPAVDVLLRDEDLARWSDGLPRRVVVDALRTAADSVRQAILTDALDEPTEASLRREILSQARQAAQAAMQPHYCHAVNATGIILHTGLGRAVLAKAALNQIAKELSGYSVLQLGVETGKRSRRDERIEWLLQQLTGCEAATVVNNNAAATALVLNTVGKGREIIVSRGQLVEIGGSFRLPEVMEAAGVRLLEVGTTNKAHARDYERAIGENTAGILRVHPSNYKIMGFSAEVPLKELVAIAHAHGLPLIDDVGAGALIDFAQFGFHEQERLQDSVRAGSDLIMSSADKLIGSSQGGIILGTAEWLTAIRKNPVARIVRVGKLTLAALEATLTLFLDETVAMRELPTLRMLARTFNEIGEQAERISAALRECAPEANVAVIDGSSQMGSGSLPTESIPTRLVAVASPALDAETLAARLRGSSPPVFARIQKDHVLVDPRTLLDGDEALLLEAFAAALTGR
ncbi:MAG: L-seryl-tRNA(Sec) selenium transferase [Verrucomicrobia bacterium]|nr:L-seryl-tRNA(Sec) selenium transferase [Verrucomicrobiota bacterium]